MPLDMENNIIKTFYMDVTGRLEKENRFNLEW